jgi:hypothetical protein
VVTVNTTSGPFSAYNGAAEADTLTDDNDTDGGGADDVDADYEGVRLYAGTTYTGARTCDAFLKAGTETGATITIATDGTGSKTCTFSGLDTLATATTVNGVIEYVGLPTGWGRISCATTIGGVPTATTGDLLVGDAAGDAGTIIASAHHAWRLAYTSRPCLAGGTAATCNVDALSVSATGWPTRSGRVSLRYTPGMVGPAGLTRYLVETLDGAVDYGWYLRIDHTTALRWFSESVAGAGDYSTSGGLAWTPGTTYLIVAQWRANGAVKVWRDGVPVIDDVLGDVADQNDTTVYLGSYDGWSSFALGAVDRRQVQR